MPKTARNARIPFLWAFYASNRVLREEDARKVLLKWHGVTVDRFELNAKVLFPKPICWILRGLDWVNQKTYPWYKPYFWVMDKYLEPGDLIPNKWRIAMPLHVFVYWVTDQKRYWVKEFPTVQRIETEDGIGYRIL